MLHQLKRFVPAWALDLYHRTLSWVAASWYGHPSEKLIVVGVTGTNGKTTTTYLVAKALEAMGDRSGCTTTAIFKIGTREWLNDRKMTMLGRFQLQKFLHDMVKEGCRYAVIETSSQGVVQHRHRDINYDVAVFTNLTPEHIEAHGSFDAYKDAKLEFFRHVARSRRKVFDGKTLPKVAVVNRMSAYAKEFMVDGFDRVATFGVGAGEGYSAGDLKEEGWATSFTISGQRITVNLPGEVNVENAAAAYAVGRELGLPADALAKKIGTVGGVPGRFEKIDEGQPFTVIVDYAPEPASVEKLYGVVSRLPHERVIHVLGSAGGGRDVSRRVVLGRMAAEFADLVIVTNEDPYDDNPQEIINEVAAGARDVNRAGVAVQTILDRGEAIAVAMREAKPGDLVLLTGKGCEQAIMGPNGSKIPWDERDAARTAIAKIMSKSQ